MKTIKLTKPERQKLITDKLKEYPALRVSELSQDIGVSTETIRRDLDELESLEYTPENMVAFMEKEITAISQQIRL